MTMLLATAAVQSGDLGFAAVLLFVSALGLLWGGNTVVGSASGIARRFGVTELAIGATVVAVGTSLPELFVSVVAVIDGHPAIAMGNVLGSNIANVGLVLGVTAVIHPVEVKQARQTRWLLLFYLGLLGLLAAMVLVPARAELTSGHGVVLLVLLVGLIVVLYRSGRQSAGQAEEQGGDLPLLLRLFSPLLNSSLRQRLEGMLNPQKNMPVAVVFLLMGFVLLFYSGKGFVWSASTIARYFSISEFIIALALVAIGTSLPEVAVSSVAALKEQGDMSIGNVVGSNLFNILLVLGVASLFGPLPLDLADPTTLVTFLAVAALGGAMLPAVIMPSHRIGRRYGLLLLAAYGTMLGYWFV